MNSTRTRSTAFLFGRFFSPLLMITLSLGVPSVYALRPMLNQGGLEQALQHSAGAEEERERLNLLRELQGDTEVELREALWKIQAEALDLSQPNWTRATLLKAMQEGRRIIPTEGLVAVESPWGEVNLNGLNNLALYPRDGASYLIARDIEIAVVLGLLRVQRVGKKTAVSPVLVYRVLKGRIEPAVSIAWSDALLLRQRTRALYSTGLVKVGGLTFTFAAGKDGGVAEFTVNGEKVEPDEAQIRLYDVLGILHYGNGHSALPGPIKKAFQWSYLGSAAGLEETAIEMLATLARMARGRPGVLVIEAGEVEELDWLEGLLAQPAFVERVVLFGTGSFGAHELAAQHPGQVRFVDTDEVGDLVVELLSMPSPMANRISYLGQVEPFRQLKDQIRPWGLEIKRLDPNAELQLILSALGVPAETLNRIDTRRLQEQLARRRSA